MKSTETLVWIVYDIVKNKARTHIAKRCKEAGLHRVQLSVFLGTIARNRLDELRLEIEALMNEETDSVYIFPMCQPDFKKVMLMGQAFDKKLVTDEVRALFV